MTEANTIARAGGAGRPPARALRETPVDGDLPRWALAGWHEQLGVVAGITGRGPGAPGEGIGFDLGLWTEAPVGEVMGRWRAFRRAEPGLPGTIIAHQVHGAEVLMHDRAIDGWLIREGADGHVTTAAGVLLCVTVADCIPVYLAAPERRGIALLHAGWRGTAGGILARGVERLCRAAGCAPADLAMHCGVGICGSCYEVGAEVVRGVGLEAEGDGPWHVDLRDRLAGQASALGLRDVTISPWCSAGDREHFYSHRTSKGRDGRMVAYLGMPTARA